MAVQSNALTSGLSDLATTASNAVADLAGVQAGADVLASQFVDVKNAMQDLVDFANTMRNSGYYTPVGSLMPFAAATAPDGWYLCNGDLWATLGLSAGNPLYDLLNPLGYLGVPDLQGRTVVGKGTNGAVDNLNDNEGILIADVANRSPLHKHSLTGGVTNAAAFNTLGHSVDHSHGFSYNDYYVATTATNQLANGSFYGRTYNENTVRSGSTGGASTDHTHQVPAHGHAHTFAVGTGAGINDTMPFLTLNYIIKS